MTDWGVLGEFYVSPCAHFGLHMLLPHLLLIGSAGWLAVVVAKHKDDAIAWAVGLIGILGGFYWTVFWGPQARQFSHAPRVVLSEISFVKVPAGREHVGSPRTEYGRREPVEGQREVVRTQDLWFSETEVTQEQFSRVLPQDPNPSAHKGANMPLNNVTLRIAKRLCDELNAREPGWHFRLPTEDEWESACRAGEQGPICTGTRGNPSDSSDLERLKYDLKKTAVYEVSSPTEVAGRLPNRYGLYDIQGNVAEMCCEQPDAWNMTEVPVRGGSWAAIYPSVRCAARTWVGCDEPKASVGLRLLAVPTKRGSRTAGGASQASIGNLPAKPRWARYFDGISQGLGSLLLVMYLIAVRRNLVEESFVPADVEHAGLMNTSTLRLPLLWIFVWTAACMGTIARPYLSTYVKMPFFGQIHPVQEHVFAALSMLLGLVMISLGIKSYPACKFYGLEVSEKPSRARVIVTALYTAVALYIILRPVVDLSTWANRNLVLQCLPDYRPNPVGGFSVLGNLAGTRGSVSTPELEGLWKFIVPAIPYSALFVGIVFEEMFFRGLLQGYFRCLGGWRWAAIFLPNVIYAAIILSTMPDQALPMFLIGLAAGFTREFSYYPGRAESSLFCGIVLRLLFSAKGFLWLHLGVPYVYI